MNQEELNNGDELDLGTGVESDDVSERHGTCSKYDRWIDEYTPVGRRRNRLLVTGRDIEGRGKGCYISYRWSSSSDSAKYLFRLNNIEHSEGQADQLQRTGRCHAIGL